MRKRFICKMLWLSALVASIGACTDEMADVSEPPRLVVEGYMDSNGYPVVMLTTSLVPSDEEVSIGSTLVRWGKVTISDGDTTIIMTGSPSKRYFPPYVYRTFEMRGVPGKRYRITASYEEMEVESEEEMPPCPRIDSISVRAISENDSLRSATLYFTAPEDVPAYYHMSVQVVGIDSVYMPSMMGVCEASTPGEVCKMAVYRGKSSLLQKEEKFVAQLPRYRSVMVRLERVTKAVYDFWMAYNDASMLGGSQFVSIEKSLPTNVVGGYGIWSVQGVDICELPSGFLGICIAGQ